MLNVIITIGIPASGKSSKVSEFLKENKNYIKVSRDDFRYMLRNQSITEPKIERMISKLLMISMKMAIKNNYNIIVDNTHLKEKYIKEIIKIISEYATIEYWVFNIPLDVCIIRDSLREKYVGEDVINKMYKDYLILNKTFIKNNLKDIKIFRL